AAAPSAVTPLHLVDEFADITAGATGPKTLCTPVAADEWGVIDPAAHLEGYAIRRAGLPQGGAVRQSGFKVVDMLGGAGIDFGKPDSLLVPSAADPATAPPLLDPASHDIDHYQCYQVKIARGTPRFPKGKRIELGDEFGATARVYSVVKPLRLCAPVDQNG